MYTYILLFSHTFVVSAQKIIYFCTIFTNDVLKRVNPDISTIET